MVRSHEKAPIHQSTEENAEHVGLEVLAEVDIDSGLIVGDKLGIWASSLGSLKLLFN